MKKLALFLASLCVAIMAMAGFSARATSRPGATTVFVHGLQGTHGSTDYMIRDLSRRYPGTKKVMTINVTAAGKLVVHGHMKKVAHPLVQVNFLNNSATTTKNAHWLIKALAYLKSKSDVKQVNLVAHSAGNVAAYQALAYQSTRIPTVKKFVILAGPFDGVLSLNDEPNKNKVSAKNHYNPSIKYPANQYYPSYERLMQLSSTFPHSIKVLNIYGNIGDGSNSDTLVTNASSLSVNYLLRHQKTPVVNKCWKSSKATHSGLHKSQKIDDWIAGFLW